MHVENIKACCMKIVHICGISAEFFNLRKYCIFFRLKKNCSCSIYLSNYCTWFVTMIFVSFCIIFFTSSLILMYFSFSVLQRPGIFNSPFRPAPHEMELLLRQVKHQVPTRLAPQSRAPPFGTPSAATPCFLGALEFTTPRSSRPILPPIASKKQHVMMDDQQVMEQDN